MPKNSISNDLKAKVKEFFTTDSSSLKEELVKEFAHRLPEICFSIGKEMDNEFTDDPIIMEDLLKQYRKVCEDNKDFHPLGKSKFHKS